MKRATERKQPSLVAFAPSGDRVARPNRSRLALRSADSSTWPQGPSSSQVRLLATSDLDVVFQPIVELVDDSIYAQEALVRCSWPEYAEPPALFNDAAESNCTGQLGRMIREIAVPLCPGQRLFVNVHPGELDEGFLIHPDDPIFFHDHEVYVELTEAVPVADMDRCSVVLKELRRRAGIKLAIDDFGAGFSNLHILADLEPDVVKLDRGLIHGISANRRQQVLATWLVRLCHDLGARVVAEGIETRDDLMAVRDTGMSYAQGFFLGRPEALRSASGVSRVPFRAL
jgi:EAL domain-containing protein (putative c-di-GMP-specific phosphodiesterase class I)